ncbi:AAA family ATPase [Mesorhizobium sp. DCY119]|uniref:AAA family ATPase n=1 Tax=Mesorhizobium sp. DCY119 TaxID=2108445 RepID=UPI000E6C7C97|nr:AAA family ATPase [Mesorhizobium sp. DCY119]RJG45465.1 hypothetical protein D3Y55_15175 [Mesorhizobium sp. DCY119]
MTQVEYRLSDEELQERAEIVNRTTGDISVITISKFASLSDYERGPDKRLRLKNPAGEPENDNKPGSAPNFRLLTVSDIAHLPDPEWLIDGLLPQSGFVVLFGPAGSKKSFIGLDWASSIATGLPWAGHAVQQRDVVYIYSEGVSGLKLRNRAWQDDRQREPKRLLFQPHGIDVANPRVVRDFVTAIGSKGYRPGLLIVDTLARNFGNGDENTAKDMNAFVTGCDALRSAFPGCTVLVIHHTGKDSRKGTRGSTVLMGAADTAIEVHSDPKTPTGYIKGEKQKDAEPFGAMNFRLVSAGKSAVLTWKVDPEWSDFLDQPAKQRSLPRSDSAVLAALDKHPEGLSYTDLLKASKQKKRTFDDALTRLKTNKKIELGADGVYVRI